LDKLSESPILPLPVPALARIVENVILSQLAVDASKIPARLVSFFRSRVIKARWFASLDFSLERVNGTFNRRTEVLVLDVYRGFKGSFLGSGFEPFKVCWLDCSLKFSISENKAFKSCSTRRLTEQD
jgi:hypothetical protein